MTNVSKDNIEGDAYVHAETQLVKVISRLTSASSSDLLYGLLTDSERVMLIKRFGVIFMLHKKQSPYRAASLLGLSEPTAHRLKEHYLAGEFDSLLNHITHKEAATFLETLRDITLSKASPQARSRLLKRAINY